VPMSRSSDDSDARVLCATHRDSPPRPTLDVLVERARALQPSLREAAEEAEKSRRVSAEIMRRAVSAGLANLMKPARFGGYEYGPSALIRIAYELAQGCGSTAWAVMIANVDNWFASYWPLEVQQDIWGTNPDNLIAGLGVPTGSCERAEGGFQIKGRWPWASNCENSAWAFVSALLPEADGTAGGVGWFMVPLSQLAIDQDSWFVSGMQGTGSKTLYADAPIFVPAVRTIRFDDIATRRVPGCSVPANPMANFAFSTFGAAGLLGPIIGMARGALDCFVEATKAKVRVSMRPGAPTPAGQNPFVQERIGRAGAMIDAALTVALAELQAAEQQVFATGQLGIDERIRVRRTFGFCVRQAVDAVCLVTEMAGASAADSRLPLQRFWRDINAASRHVSFDVPGINTMSGQHTLGLPPVGAF